MNQDTPKTERRLFSIGHSNHPLETFLGLLQRYQIGVLVDVRSYPYSNFAPRFDTHALKTAVTTVGIKYVFLGKELGGRPEGPEFYDAEGYVLYSRVAESPVFLEGSRLLEQELSMHPVALLCSEEDPSYCHRRLLVGRVLVARGVVLDHVRGDGRVQTEAELANEEARRHDNGQMRLFDVQEDKPWKSTQSVLQKRRRQTSSEH